MTRGSLPARGLKEGLQPRELRRYRRWTAGNTAIDLARRLTIEQPRIDRCAGAGERQERHRDVRILDCKRERSAHLIAIERTVTGGVEPTRRDLVPLLIAAAAFTRAVAAIP